MISGNISSKFPFWIVHCWESTFAKLVPAEGLALVNKELLMLNNKRLKTKNKWLNSFSQTLYVPYDPSIQTILNIYSILAFTKKKNPLSEKKLILKAHLTFDSIYFTFFRP